MESATHLGLPWRLLRDKLAPPDTPNSSDVSYNKTLELLDTDSIVSLYTFCYYYINLLLQQCSKQMLTLSTREYNIFYQIILFKIRVKYFQKQIYF